jgi:hypothetical protein
MQGRFLDKICQDRPELTHIMERHVLDQYQVELEDLPSWEDDLKATAAYETKLSRDYMKFGVEDPFYSRGNESNGSTPKANTEGGDNHELVSQSV